MSSFSTTLLSQPSAALSPELRLLLTCVQAQVDDTAASRLGGLAQQPTDWGRFWALGEQHGLLPLAYWHLVRSRPAPLLPDPWRLRLEQAFYHNTARNLQLGEQLRLLLAQLHAAGIPAIPLKGSDLARRLYGNEALRQSGDLDILIPAHLRAAADGQILTLGFESVQSRSLAQRVQRWHSHHDAFVQRRQRVYLELHWHFAPQNLAPALDLGQIWARSVDGAFDGVPCRRLADLDLAIFLCLHGSKHHWVHLRWLADVALLAAHGAVDWERLLAYCSQAGCARMLLLQAQLLATLFGLAAPPALVAAAADRHLPGLVDRIIACIEAPERYRRSNSLQLMALDAGLRERPLDRLRVLAASLAVMAGFHAAQWVVQPFDDQPQMETDERR